LKSANTKERYETRLQSITFLYNLVDNYNNPEKDYFEFIFSNNKAIDDRFLKLRLDGNLIEEFKKDFDVPAVAEANKMVYINYAKSLLYLQNLKQRNGYVRRFKRVVPVGLTTRQKMTHDNISWLIDVYAFGQGEYDNVVGVLNHCVGKYDEMVAPLKNEVYVVQKEERVVGVLTGEDSDDLEEEQ